MRRCWASRKSGGYVWPLQHHFSPYWGTQEDRNGKNTPFSPVQPPFGPPEDSQARLTVEPPQRTAFCQNTVFWASFSQRITRIREVTPLLVKIFNKLKPATGVFQYLSIMPLIYLLWEAVSNKSFLKSTVAGLSPIISNCHQTIHTHNLASSTPKYVHILFT